MEPYEAFQSLKFSFTASTNVLFGLGFNLCLETKSSASLDLYAFPVQTIPFCSTRLFPKHFNKAVEGDVKTINLGTTNQKNFNCPPMAPEILLHLDYWKIEKCLPTYCC